MFFSVSWQLGLVEREINEILRGINSQVPQQPSHTSAQRSASKTNQSDEATSGVKQREITEDDVCPICQDEFLNKRAPVTFCRYVQFTILTC